MVSPRRHGKVDAVGTTANVAATHRRGAPHGALSLRRGSLKEEWPLGERPLGSTFDASVPPVR